MSRRLPASPASTSAHSICRPTLSACLAEWAGPDIRICYSLHSGVACGAGITGGCIKAAVLKGFMQMGQFLEVGWLTIAGE